jgi:signal peptidase I
MGRLGTTTQAQPRTRVIEVKARESHRDTVEAIVVAFMLALVVRGFEAQAFVIPTGSMAPTLMGRHKEVLCPQCGFVYAVNASDEVEPRAGTHDVFSGICVNCRHQARLKDSPSFKGDRILVMMFPYDLTSLPGAKPPERWDVVVFRYPEEPEVSYIKRLVGLPGETLRIHHGDVFIRPPGQEDFAIARKPYKHLRSMEIAVYDDRNRPTSLAGRPEWRRWAPTTGTAWKLDEDRPGQYRMDSSGSPGESWAELRYRHLVPDPEQWDAVLNERPLPRLPRPTLVTDFYSYNTNMASLGGNLLGDGPGDHDAWMQPHWVGDLMLSATLEVESTAGLVRFELIKGGIAYRCEIDLATGSASFFQGETKLGETPTPVKGKGRYQVDLANVDSRLILAVDGYPVLGPDSQEGFAYDSADETTPIPTEADLSPAAFAVRNASATVSDLVLKRDIYYTQQPGRNDYSTVWEDHYPRTPVELFDFLADPSRFPNLAKVGTREYPIGVDRYLMMGDNSPRSKDSRGWDSADSAWDPGDRQTWEVPRNLLTGKAFYIYWPHGVPLGPIPFLFRPYFERMKWIR